MKTKIAKGFFYLICAGLVLYFSVQPPQRGSAQWKPLSDTQATNQRKVDSLQITLDEKAAELRSLIQKVNEEQPKVVYRTRIKYKNHNSITVYTRIDGEVTEHKVVKDNGFYVMDLKPNNEVYYIDTCIDSIDTVYIPSTRTNWLKKLLKY